MTVLIFFYRCITELLNKKLFKESDFYYDCNASNYIFNHYLNNNADIMESNPFKKNFILKLLDKILGIWILKNFVYPAYKSIKIFFDYNFNWFITHCSKYDSNWEYYLHFNDFNHLGFLSLLDVNNCSIIFYNLQIGNVVNYFDTSYISNFAQFYAVESSSFNIFYSISNFINWLANTADPLVGTTFFVLSVVLWLATKSGNSNSEQFIDSIITRSSSTDNSLTEYNENNVIIKDKVENILDNQDCSKKLPDIILNSNSSIFFNGEMNTGNISLINANHQVYEYLQRFENIVNWSEESILILIGIFCFSTVNKISALIKKVNLKDPHETDWFTSINNETIWKVLDRKNIEEFLSQLEIIKNNVLDEDVQAMSILDIQDEKEQKQAFVQYADTEQEFTLKCGKKFVVTGLISYFIKLLINHFPGVEDEIYEIYNLFKEHTTPSSGSVETQHLLMEEMYKKFFKFMNFEESSKKK